VLASGYYYPTMRLDVLLFTPPAVPVIGDVMRYTVSPLVTRLILPGLIKRLFQPAPVTERFRRFFPRELAVRPSQLRAAAADTAFMIPAAMELRRHYRELDMPVAIVTGAEDRIADEGRQSARLHRELTGSEFVRVPGAGHMIHHLAPDEVIGAVERVARRAA
jgi:pimeloyl-ACP methyl ester carboxylesterase